MLALAVVEPGQQPRSGIDLMIEALHSQGLNPALIRSGYAEIEMVARASPPSQESIQKEADAIAENLKRAYANVTDKKAKASVERAIRSLPGTLTNMKTERRSRFRILFDGNDFSGRRKFSVSNFNSETKQWDKPVEALRRYAGKGGGENVMWQTSATLATISNKDLALPEFQEFGRVCGPASRMLTAALLKGTDPSAFDFPAENVELVKKQFTEISRQTGGTLYELAGQVQYDGGAMAYVVENRSKGRVVQRYWLDASRGHICPLIQYIDESDQVTAEWKSSDYFLHDESGLWFPAKHIYTQYQSGTNRIAEQIEYTIERNTFKLNQPVALDEFAIEIPANAHILDTRSGRQVRYRTNEPITLSFIQGGLDLSRKNVTLIADMDTHKKTPGVLSLRLPWFLIANVLVILVIASLLLARRYRTIGLVIFVSSIFICGCSDSKISTETRATASSEPMLSGCGCGLAAPQRDVWYGGPVRIDTASRGRLEVCTVKYPGLQFDFRNLEPGIKIREITRGRIGDQTTITFQISLDGVRPPEIMLTPSHDELGSLTVPVIYPIPERPAFRKDLWPDRISLGVISPNQTKTFALYGDPSILNVIDVVSQTGLPAGMVVKAGPVEEGKRTIAMHSAGQMRSGLFDGELRLRSLDGREFTIRLAGMVK